QYKIKSQLINLRRHLINQMELLLGRIHYTLEIAKPHSLINIINRKLFNYQQQWDDLWYKCEQTFKQNISIHQRRLGHCGSTLKAIDPGKVLKRGYVYIDDSEGNLINSKAVFRDIKEGHQLNLHFIDGIEKVIK
ncbi:MAG: exodeoxyribonuclease VII large subunit, partial [bacterium]